MHENSPSKPRLLRSWLLWVLGLIHPGKGSVSMRAHAERADGGTVDYTVIRAYNLR